MSGIEDLNKYAFIWATDPKTGICCQSSPVPGFLQSAQENVAMYERHIKKEDMGFSIERTEKNYEQLCKSCPEHLELLIPRYYEPHAFNSALKEKKEKYITIPKDPRDSRDCPWVIRLDAMEEEARWVRGIFEDISDKMYRASVKDKDNKFKIFGSCAHRGYVNVLFDRTHEANMGKIREWIQGIGETFDPEKIKELKFSSYQSSVYDRSIYRNGFYPNHVRELCEYCETMFGVDKYIVASCFAKEEVREFADLMTIGKNGEKAKSNFNLMLTCNIGAIHAENGDYEEALKCFETIKDTYGFVDKAQGLIDYFKKNGTSVLSTSF